MKDDFPARLRYVLDNVAFPNYKFEYEVDEAARGGCRLRAVYADIDVETELPGIQKTRWWLVSQHATKSEIVQTMFKCILTSAEHYTREHFKYKGRAVFGPHFSVEALWNACETTDKRVDLREQP